MQFLQSAQSVSMVVSRAVVLCSGIRLHREVVIFTRPHRNRRTLLARSSVFQEAWARYSSALKQSWLQWRWLVTEFLTRHETMFRIFFQHTRCHTQDSSGLASFPPGIHQVLVSSRDAGIRHLYLLTLHVTRRWAADWSRGFSIFLARTVPDAHKPEKYVHASRWSAVRLWGRGGGRRTTSYKLPGVPVYFHGYSNGQNEVQIGSSSYNMVKFVGLDLGF